MLWGYYLTLSYVNPLVNLHEYKPKVYYNCSLLYDELKYYTHIIYGLSFSGGFIGGGKSIRSGMKGTNIPSGMFSLVPVVSDWIYLPFDN